MIGNLKRIAEAIGSAEQEIIVAWQSRLAGAGGNYARGLIPETELQREMRTLLGGVRALLADGISELDATHALVGDVRKASGVRAARGFTPEESILFLHAGKEAMIEFGSESLASDPAARLEAVLVTSRLLDQCVRTLVSTFVSAREDIIDRQSASLRELSTPVITLWDSVLLLPLVGIVDSARARQIAEELLEAIGRSEAAVTLIDVTGVPVMDTSVARHILKTVAAAQMLGTQIILTGIRPETAQTMVKLGVDLSSVPTRGTLRSGVALALKLVRRKVVDVTEG